MSKKILALILALALTVGLLPCAAFAAGETAEPAYTVNESYMLGAWHGEYSGTPNLMVGKVDATLDLDVQSYLPNEVYTDENGVSYVGAWYVKADYYVHVKNLILAALINDNGGENGSMEGTEYAKFWIDAATGTVVSVAAADGDSNLLGMVEDYGTLNMYLNCREHYVNASANLSYLTLSASVSVNVYKKDAPTGHYALRHTPAKAACVEDGNIEHWDCGMCGVSYSDSACTQTVTAGQIAIPAVGHHTPAKTEAHAASCTEAGNIEYWTCENCGGLFADEACTQSITAEETVLPILPHDLSQVAASDSTCTKNGCIEHWACKDCDALFGDEAGTLPLEEGDVFLPLADHSDTHYEAKTSSCTVAGNIEYWQCDTCLKFFSDADYENEIGEDDVKLPLTDHDPVHHDYVAPGEQNGNIEYWQCKNCLGCFLDAACTQSVTAEGVIIYAIHGDIVYYNVDGEDISFPDRKDTYNYYTGLAVGAPTRTGYTFDGWFTDKSFKNPLADNTIPPETLGTVTLYAKWTVNTYTVAFDKNADNATGTVKDQKHTYGKTVALTANAYKRPGFTFTGWNTEADGSGLAYADKVKVTNLTEENGAVVTLYAQWAPVSYAINYKNVLATDENPNPVSYTALDETITLTALQRTGWDFGGWYLDTGFKKPVSELTTDQAKALTVYAQWTAHTYTIVFDKNADNATGTVKDQLHTYDKAVALTANAYKRPGFTFTGWNTEANGSGTAYADKLKITNLTEENGAVITLYAQWAPISYAINYKNVLATDENPNPVSYTGLDETITLTALQRTGWDFGGWYLDTGFKKPVSELTTDQAKALTVYAQWTAHTYTVVFDKNADDATGTVKDQLHTYDKAVALTANAYKRVGYTFIGWNTEPNGTGTAYTDKLKVTNLTEENGAVITLYAQWSNNTYTLTFNGNTGKAVDPNTGKTVTTYTQTLAYDVSFELDANRFTKPGYTYTGWNTVAKGTGVAFADGELGVFNLTSAAGGKATVYAQWKANEYTVAFDLNGAEGSMEPMTVAYDKSVKLPAAIVRPGYTFAGWTCSADGKLYKDKSSIKNLSAEDGAAVTMTASWTPNAYTVTFNFNGGKYTADKTTFAKQNCAYDMTAIEIPEALPEFVTTTFAYKFVGWSDNKLATEDGEYNIYQPGDFVNFPAAKNKAAVTLYAVWSYEAIFHDGDNQKTVTLYYNVPGTVDGENFNYAHNGYCISGWALTEANAAKGSVKYKSNAVKNVGEGTELYAVWSPITYTVTFHSNFGGTAAEKTKVQKLTYEKEAALTANSFKLTGHTFLGWATEEGGPVVYTNSQKVMNLTTDPNVTYNLYAVWG